MQPGFNAHRTGTNIFETEITGANSVTLAEAWSAGDPYAEVVRSASGQVHTILDDRLRTYDLDDGALLWATSAPLTAGTVMSPTVLAGANDVVVPDFRHDRTPSGCLFRFESATGAADPCIPFPAGDDVPTDVDVWLTAIRSGDWVAVVVQHSSDEDEDPWTSRISVANLRDPGAAWTYVQDDATSLSNPIIVGTRLFVARSADPGGGGTTQLEGWDLAARCGSSCSPALVVPYEGFAPSGISASGDGRRIAIADDDLVMVDVPSGEVLWTGPGGTYDQRMIPTWVGDKVVIVAAEEAVRAFDEAGCGAATCAPAWEWAPESPEDLGRPLGQPAGANGIVFLATDTHTLVALPSDCDDPCMPLLRLTDGDGWGGPPIVTAGTVLYNGADGLTALRPPDWWGQAGFDSHGSSHNPSEVTLTPTSVAGVEQLWEGGVDPDGDDVQSSFHPRLVSSPEGLLHVAGGAAVLAFDAATGAQRWRTPYPGGPPDAPASIVADRDGVFVAVFDTPSAVVLVLDPATGAIELTIPIAGPAQAEDFHGGPGWLARRGEWLVATFEDERSAELVISVVNLREPTRSWTRRTGAGSVDQASNPVVVGENPVLYRERLYIETVTRSAGSGGSPSRRLEGYDLDVPCPATACDPAVVVPLEGSDPAGAIAASPDGRSIAVLGSGDVTVVDVDVHSGQVRFSGVRGCCDDPSVRPAWVGGAVVVPSSVPGPFGSPSRTELLAFEGAGCGAPVCEPSWRSVSFAAAQSPVVSAGGVLWILAEDGSAVALEAGCDRCAPLVVLEGIVEDGLGFPIVSGGRLHVAEFASVTTFGLTG
jgi:outer membrane protein assembly factor BamB